MRRVGALLISAGIIAAVGFATVSGQAGGAAQRGATAKPYTTWRSYGGGAHSSQYTALDQINKSNVAKLDVAWTYPVTGNIIFNPVVIDGIMYLPVGNAVVALEAHSGRALWNHPVEGGLVRRGVTWWAGDRQQGRAI